jgi:hypothetical protein
LTAGLGGTLPAIERKLFTRKKALCISLRNGKTSFLEMGEKNLFVVRCPPIMVTLPACITDKEATIQIKFVAFVSMWAILVRGPTDIAFEHEFFLGHFITPRYIVLTPNVEVTGAAQLYRVASC